MDIKSIKNKEISSFLNSARHFLDDAEFQEYLLPVYTDYSISNVEQIKTETNKILRTTTEPEIWLLAKDSLRFFCITSLFRRENIASKLHKEEFKIVDFYKQNSSNKDILQFGIEMLKNFEKDYNLPLLSNLEIVEIEFDNFKKICEQIKTPTIINVVNYPIEESFYDEVNPETGKTHKGELFYVDSNFQIEFSVYGKVANNKNPEIQLIKNKAIYTFPNNLFGMCFGFERVIMVYKILRLNQT